MDDFLESGIMGENSCQYNDNFPNLASASTFNNDTLLGYSQGASVVLEAIQNFIGPVEYGNKAVVFVGNPYQAKNQTSTIDQKGSNFTGVTSPR